MNPTSTYVSNHSLVTTSGLADHKEEDENMTISTSQILLVIFALLLSFFVIFVNSLTIHVIRKTQCLHTLSNTYVISLACTDLIVGLGLIPLSLFYIPYIRSHYYDRNLSLCVLLLGVNLGMAVVSTLHMVLIATDRYLYILWPYSYQKVMTRKTVSLTLSGVWVFGFTYALMPQLIHNEPASVSRCDITMVMPIEYLFYGNVSIYTFCVIIDVSLYTRILSTAYKQRRIIEANQPNPATTTTIQVAVTRSSQHRVEPAHCSAQTVIHHNGTHPGETTTPRNSISSARRRYASYLKSVRFFMTVFGVYFICLTPTVICMGIDFFQRLPRFLYNMFNLLALMNSGMNFIIYLVLNAKFRIAVLKFFHYPGWANMAESTDGSNYDG